MPNLTLYTNPFIVVHPNPLQPFYSYAPSAHFPHAKDAAHR